MANLRGFSVSSLTLAALLSAAGTLAGLETASAAVYCKTVGFPKGCVAAPVARPVVVAPVVVAPVVVAPVARYPVAGVGVGAPGVGVRAGTPMNRGGPVNRVGVR